MSQTRNSVEPVHEIPIHGLIIQCLHEDNAEGLASLLDPLSFSDALREVLLFSSQERGQILSQLPPGLAAQLIEEAPNELAAELMEGLQSNTAADIIDVLDSDIRADVIGEMDEEDAEAILGEMNPQDAADVRRLASYDEDTAGGLMAAELFVLTRKTPFRMSLDAWQATRRILSAIKAAPLRPGC